MEEQVEKIYKNIKSIYDNEKKIVTGLKKQSQEINELKKDITSISNTISNIKENIKNTEKNSNETFTEMRRRIKGAVELISNISNRSISDEEVRDINKEIKEINTKIAQVEKFAKPDKEISYKDFSPADVYDLHYDKKMSIAKIARYLHCSNGTVINRINQYKKEVGLK